MSSGVIYAVTWARPPYTIHPYTALLLQPTLSYQHTFTFTPIFAVNMTTSLQKKLILAVYHFCILKF